MDFPSLGRPPKFETDNICVEFLMNATVVSLLLNDGMVLHVTLLFVSNVAITGTLTSNPEWEDCKRVFTTSNGQVTTAPAVPASLQNKNYSKINTILPLLLHTQDIQVHNVYFGHKQY